MTDDEAVRKATTGPFRSTMHSNPGAKENHNPVAIGEEVFRLA
jgi:hypothetical protein